MGKLVREAVVIVPLQLKSPWSLDLGKAACRGNEQVGFPLYVRRAKDCEQSIHIIDRVSIRP